MVTLPPVSELKVNAKDVDGSELADVFNHFFTHMTTTGSTDAACEYVKNRNVQSLYLSPITAHEVSPTIKGIKNSTSCDVDGIQICPVKEVSDVIAPILAYIFKSV